MKGYNPLWILNKDNYFIEKRHSEGNLILNKSSVETAMYKLTISIKKSVELQEDALNEFKSDITSYIL